MSHTEVGAIAVTSQEIAPGDGGRGMPCASGLGGADAEASVCLLMGRV